MPRARHHSRPGPEQPVRGDGGSKGRRTATVRARDRVAPSRPADVFDLVRQSPEISSSRRVAQGSSARARSSSRPRATLTGGG
jgi:hypothetical protein